MERKIYYSFHDIPFDEYSYGYVKPKISFSKTELIHLFISIVILTIAFASAFSYPVYVRWRYFLYKAIPMAFLAIITAFVFHELAHKFTGQKYGYWSEYRMFPQGLLFALLLGLTTPFVFAAPGAVTIFGMPTREEGGKIAMAGPLTNIIVSIVFYILSLFCFQNIFRFVAWVNIFLAAFNLIPLGPLDGKKVFYWDIKIWATLLIISVALWFII